MTTTHADTGDVPTPAVNPDPPLSKADTLKGAGSIIVTILLFVVIAIWIFFVAKNLGTAPTYNKDGTVKVDEYSRAKDILVIFVPLLTTAVGFWLGSQGTVQAQKQTAVANATAVHAQSQAHKAGIREKLAYAASSEPDLMEKASRLADASGVTNIWS